MYKTFHSGGSDAPMHEAKLYKYIDPKKEKFSNQLKNDTKQKADKANDRLERTK